MEHDGSQGSAELPARMTLRWLAASAHFRVGVDSDRL